MKLKKFSESAAKVIDEICLLDPNGPNAEMENAIRSAISKFDKELTAVVKKDKPWRLQRQELSLFYNIAYLDGVFVAKPAPEIKSREVINFFKRLKTNEVMEDLLFLRIGIVLGLVRLSPEEITLLIAHNKK